MFSRIGISEVMNGIPFSNCSRSSAYKKIHSRIYEYPGYFYSQLHFQFQENPSEISLRWATQRDGTAETFTSRQFFSAHLQVAVPVLKTCSTSPRDWNIAVTSMKKTWSFLLIIAPSTRIPAPISSAQPNIWRDVPRRLLVFISDQDSLKRKPAQKKNPLKIHWCGKCFQKPWADIHSMRHIDWFMTGSLQWPTIIYI